MMNPMMMGGMGMMNPMMMVSGPSPAHPGRRTGGTRAHRVDLRVGRDGDDESHVNGRYKAWP